LAYAKEQFEYEEAEKKEQIKMNMDNYI
jgi:hypothetical protein